jgi:hypothetical protein
MTTMNLAYLGVNIGGTNCSVTGLGIHSRHTRSIAQ